MITLASIIKKLLQQGVFSWAQNQKRISSLTFQIMVFIEEHICCHPIYSRPQVSIKFSTTYSWVLTITLKSFAPLLLTRNTVNHYKKFTQNFKIKITEQIPYKLRIMESAKNDLNLKTLCQRENWSFLFQKQPNFGISSSKKL